MDKEIGGYIELEQNRMPMLHNEALALNCGRNCLAYLIKLKGIRKIALPYFLCDSVENVCRKEGVNISYYQINQNFLPRQLHLQEDEWLYLVNFYGQVSNEKILEYANQYPKIIIDHAHAYYQKPLVGIDTLYSCRKFFGVPDGGFLYTDIPMNITLEIDESFERMHFLLGRYERTASEFYSEYSANNHMFANESIKYMSRLTDNLLRGIDYVFIKQRRTENFIYLHERLNLLNKLDIKIIAGAYMYPLFIENGAIVREYLQSKKVYIPILWPHVLKFCSKNSLEYQMAENILPLPVDQRYGLEDMEYLVRRLEECIN